jgi:hypothetical protein
MATVDQQAYIKDLVLKKFGTFSDFKKWLATTGIVRTNGQIFAQSLNLVEISNRITPAQATAIIEALTPLEDLNYKTSYEQDQIDEVSALLKEIDEEVQSWTFPA